MEHNAQHFVLLVTPELFDQLNTIPLASPGFQAIRISYRWGELELYRVTFGALPKGWRLIPLP